MNIKYGISWIYDELVVCQFNRNKLIETWVAPFPVLNFEDFERCLTMAKDELKMATHASVSIVFNSEEQSHSFIDLPPMSKKNTKQYIERNIDKEKNFSYDAAWSYNRVTKGSSSDGALLNIIPKQLKTNIVSACYKQKFEISKILPFTEVIGQCVSGLGKDAGEISVVVAVLKQHIEVVVINSAGETFFVRDLNITWDREQHERLKMDIERTLLYAKQQGASVSQILVLGMRSFEVVDCIKNDFTIPVLTNEYSVEQSFWAYQLQNTSNLSTSNYIQISLRDMLMRRNIINMGSWAAIASVFTAISVTIAVESIPQNKNMNFQDKLIALETELEQLNLTYNKEIRASQIIDNLLETPEPIPVWFIYELGNKVPISMVLSKAKIELKDKAWGFTLEGANNPTFSNSVAQLEQLETSLEMPPWNASVDASWREEWIQKLKQGKAYDEGLIAFTMEGNL